MRNGARNVLLVPPDVPGYLAAAAWLRNGGMDGDVQIVAPHELSRRLLGLSTEPVKRQVTVVDLVPTDSIDSLLVPALTAFRDAGIPVRFLFGDRDLPEPPQAIRDLTEIRSEKAPSWRVVAGSEDREYSALADALETGPMREEWIPYLKALGTSWDWPRIYGALRNLAALLPLSEEERQWSSHQMNEVQRCRSVVGTAPIRTIDDIRVAVVLEPVAAHVRPEVLAGVRGEVDAVAFAGGPNRLVILGTLPDFDLCTIPQIAQLTEADRDSQWTVQVADGRVELTWPPENRPPQVESLLGEALTGEMSGLNSPVPAAKVVHSIGQRGAKVLHRQELHPLDMQRIRQAFTGEAHEVDGNGAAAGQDERTVLAPALQNRIEVVPEVRPASVPGVSQGADR